MKTEFLKTLDYFEKLTKIPRGSTNRAPVRDFLCAFAREKGLRYRTDSADNVVIWKAAGKGYENRSPVILQGHTDMVCVKEEGYETDFQREGLKLCKEGDFLFAQGTSLGGDDGIAVAMMLALLESSMALPPLVCLFTADEEIGMIGAEALDMSDIEGNYLINIDSEEEGVLTVSCAGGSTAVLSLPYALQQQSGYVYEIAVGGLAGGHSGMEIGKGGSNACKVLGEVLAALPAHALVRLEGGEKENAIATAAKAAVLLKEPAQLQALCESIRAQHIEKEPHIGIHCTGGDAAQVKATDSTSTAAIEAALLAMPQGVIKMSAFDEKSVQTSLNLGVIEWAPGAADFTFCVRSSVKAEREALEKELAGIAARAGGTITISGIYPSWEYRENSALREAAVAVFERLYGKKPRIEAIHAGLECGLLLEKKSELDCISIGPQMYDVHSARERLSISSCERTMEYLVELLKF